VPELRIALLTFTAALVAGLVWTPIVIRLSWAVLALDRPDARKQHGHAVPRLGGVALLASFVCGIGTALEQTVKGGDERLELVSVTR